MSKPSKMALGKGLGALIQPRNPTPQPSSPTPTSTAPEPAPGEKVVELPLAMIVPSPLQPRKEFTSDQLAELADSIREHGIIQPLIVRSVNARYELIAGERRWRASQLVGLETAPVIVREASDRDVLELALIENLQRENLNPIEEAEAYARLAAEFELKQEEIAKKVGRSRAAVANALRLLELQPEVRSWLVQTRITTGHAKALLAVKNADDQKLLAEKLIRDGSTVRAAEALVASFLKRESRASELLKPRGEGGGSAPVSGAIQHLQNRLREHLATQVHLKHGSKKGMLEIEYYGQEDLQRLLDLIGLPGEKL